MDSKEFYEKVEAYRAGVKEKYPNLFPTEPVEISVGPGWWPLLDRLLTAIEEDIKKTGIEAQVIQIKEKFRGLRFYVQGGSDDIRKMVVLAEDESYRTCEECGNVTEDKNAFERVKRGGWIVTLCDDCWKKYV